MSQLLFTILGGVITAVIVGWLGFGKSKIVVVHGVRVKKTGKWMVIISILMILLGSYLHSKGGSFASAGITIAAYGFVIFLIGRAVAWFQRL